MTDRLKLQVLNELRDYGPATPRELTKSPRVVALSSGSPSRAHYLIKSVLRTLEREKLVAWETCDQAVSPEVLQQEGYGALEMMYRFTG